MYVGCDKEGGPDGDRWVGRRHSAPRGGSSPTTEPSIQAFFAASDGGHSENVEDVWHGGNPAYAVPYLRGVCDPGEYTAANPWTDWKLLVHAPPRSRAGSRRTPAGSAR